MLPLKTLFTLNCMLLCIDKTVLKAWGINPIKIAAWISKAHRTFFCVGEGRIQRVARHAGDLLE